MLAIGDNETTYIYAVVVGVHLYCSIAIFHHFYVAPFFGQM
jgi:hypothetical protein